MKVLHRTRSQSLRWVTALLIAAIVLAACGGAPAAAPEPTATPTPAPTATPTPEPTPTPESEPTAEPEAEAAAVATPQVTIPSGFSPRVDEVRGYSLALPRGWTDLDLRSSQFQGMASTFGLGDQLGPLNEFLATPEGEAIGLVSMTDLTAVMFGGLPTLLNVSVIDAPDVTADALVEFLTANIEANQAALGDVTIESLEAATINNLPGVRGVVVADLSQVGMDAQLYAEVVGLIANDKVYVLTLATPAANRADKEPVFEQIIGTFRPE
jgi:hypothetical protein